MTARVRRVVLRGGMVDWGGLVGEFEGRSLCGGGEIGENNRSGGDLGNRR